jgi:hypothetical protein
MLWRKVVGWNHVERERLSQEEQCTGKFDLERELKVLRAIGVVDVALEVVLSEECSNREFLPADVIEVMNHQQRELSQLWELRCRADKK